MHTKNIAKHRRLCAARGYSFFFTFGLRFALTRVLFAEARLNRAAVKRNATVRRSSRRAHLHRQADSLGQGFVFFPGTVAYLQMRLCFAFSCAFFPFFFNHEQSNSIGFLRKSGTQRSDEMKALSSDTTEHGNAEYKRKPPVL